MNNGYWVLENKKGQVVRHIVVDGPFQLIYRHDNRRVEAYENESLKQLDDAKVDYTLLENISLGDKRQDIALVQEMGHLRLVKDSKKFTPSYELPTEEEKKQVQPIIFWVSGLHLFVLFTLLMFAWFGPKASQEKETTITVLQKSDIQKQELQPSAEPIPTPIVTPTVVAQPKATPQNKNIVKASQTKIKKKNTVKTVKVSKQVLPIIKKMVAKNKNAVQKTTRNKVLVWEKNQRQADPNNISNMGVLGALGGLKTKPGRGSVGGGNGSGSGKGSAGFNPYGVAGGIGFGRIGAVGAAGGHYRALYGHGVVAAAPGNTTSTSGFGGYGTQGRGGGQANYGKMNLVGPSAPPKNAEVVSGVFDISDSDEDEDQEITGGLDMDQIREVIIRNQGQVSACYEKGLQMRPELTGRVVIHFIINGNGRVNTASIIHTSLHSRTIEDCIIRRLKTWKFPKPIGQVDVSVKYPFKLKRDSQ